MDVPPRRISRIGTAGGWETRDRRTSLESPPRLLGAHLDTAPRGNGVANGQGASEEPHQPVLRSIPEICIRTSHMRRPDANSAAFKCLGAISRRLRNKTLRATPLQILQPWDGTGCWNRGKVTKLPGSIWFLPGLVGLLPPPGRSMPIRGYQKGISA